MEYGAVGRRKGTCHFSVCCCSWFLWHSPQSIHLPCRRKIGLSRKKDKITCWTPTTTGLQMGPALRMQGQNSMGPVPRPIFHSLHTVPSLGTSSLPWNVSKFSIHFTAIYSIGLHWSVGAGHHLSQDSSQKDPKICSRNSRQRSCGCHLSIKTQESALTLVISSDTSDLRRRWTFSIN